MNCRPRPFLQSARPDTTNYVRYCLKLSEDDATKPEPPNQIIAFFKVIGDATCEAYYQSHRGILLREFEFFMETSEAEQRIRLSPELPSTEEYMRARLGTSAVNVASFFNEYAYGTSISVEVLNDPDMKVTNDLRSLKKEVAQQTVDSFVPLLYLVHGNLDLAVSLVVETIENAVKDFDCAAESLARKFSDDKEFIPRLETFIRACRLNCTGNLNWSLQTGRYGVSQHSIAGGVTLRLE
ncbi:hypothetical protein INS49_005447 [Diaporthe citri]|uniref:uncharacterized protein n=1 Tax=Diaporthe citri TaxID=83186 RepID=UPI001C7E92C4|nr:uncharacterized protein INS49_005447 [Diaporthe citri]KAG6353738.1 hypothetical protein INS49_005447 [Diaporthe citri]